MTDVIQEPDNYDPEADAFGSWEVAIAALRERHLAALRTRLMAAPLEKPGPE